MVNRTALIKASVLTMTLLFGSGVLAGGGFGIAVGGQSGGSAFYGAQYTSHTVKGGSGHRGKRHVRKYGHHKKHRAYGAGRHHRHRHRVDIRYRYYAPPVFYGSYTYGPFYSPRYNTYDYDYATGGRRVSGYLQTDIRPGYAELYLNGEYVGTAEEYPGDDAADRLELTPGRYRLELRAEGYEPMKVDVRVSSDETTIIVRDLSPY